MTPFSYSLASDAPDAVMNADCDAARFLGGGTNLVDLMRQNIEAPARLIDVSRLPAGIEEASDGGIWIGAATRNSAVAAHPSIRAHYPLLSRALLAGASAQIRNMATVGGNILQRTRCTYFYDSAGSRCNKRVPGSGCDAIGGFTRYHAILGASDQCVATHPSDMCVALAALDASVEVEGADGRRAIPFADFHLLPGDTPQQETVLRPGELITGVAIAPCAAASNSSYRKVRDRSSYAFALVSVAAALDMADGEIIDVRIALGGVAHKPWRATLAEAALRGAKPGRDVFLAAANAELAHAEPLDGNAFKVALARNTIAAVLFGLSGNIT